MLLLSRWHEILRRAAKCCATARWLLKRNSHVLPWDSRWPWPSPLKVLLQGMRGVLGFGSGISCPSGNGSLSLQQCIWKALRRLHAPQWVSTEVEINRTVHLEEEVSREGQHRVEVNWVTLLEWKITNRVFLSSINLLSHAHVPLNCVDLEHKEACYPATLFTPFNMFLRNAHSL